MREADLRLRRVDLAALPAAEGPACAFASIEPIAWPRSTSLSRAIDTKSEFGRIGEHDRRQQALRFHARPDRGRS